MPKARELLLPAAAGLAAITPNALAVDPGTTNGATPPAPIEGRILPLEGSALNPATLVPRYDVSGAGINDTLVIPMATIESARNLRTDDTSYRKYVRFAIRQATSAQRQGGITKIRVFHYDLASNQQVLSGPLGPNKDTAMVVEDLNARVQAINGTVSPDKVINPEITDDVLTRRVPFSESRGLMRALASYRFLTNQKTGKNIAARDIVAALQQPKPNLALRRIDPTLAQSVPTLVGKNFDGIGVQVSWTGTPAQPQSPQQ